MTTYPQILCILSLNELLEPYKALFHTSNLEVLAKHDCTSTLAQNLPILQKSRPMDPRAGYSVKVTSDLLQVLCLYEQYLDHVNKLSLKEFICIWKRAEYQ